MLKMLNRKGVTPLSAEVVRFVEECTRLSRPQLAGPTCSAQAVFKLLYDLYEDLTDGLKKRVFLTALVS